MAKLVNPLMSTEARGKVGGIIYNTWRGIRYGKTKTAPAQPHSSRQMAIRAFCVTVVRRWRVITAPQREGWNTYATAHTDTDWTGSPQRITGINWFTRCSVRLLDMAKAVVDTAPVADAPANVAALVATGGAGQISCAFTPAGGTDTTIDLWTQGPVSVGRVASIVRAKHRSYGPGETSPLVISSLPAGYYTVFARFVSETNGLASQFVSATATVT